MDINFHWNGTNPNIIKQKTQLKEYINKKMKKKTGCLNCIFVTDDFLLEMNNTVLKHNYFTDIITFPLNNYPFEAEIYISVDRVKDNAQIHNTFFKNEIHRVIFHGCLHLLGYLDKTKEEKAVMSKMEDKWLKEYFSKY